jgi:hypothetical protein
LKPGRQQALERSIAEAEANNRMRPPKAIEQEIRLLGGQIEKRIKSLHNLPEAVQQLMGQEIEKDLQREQELAKELEQARQTQTDPSAQAADIIELARGLADAWNQQAPELIRPALVENGIQATIYCQEVQAAGRTCYKADKAHITIKTSWALPEERKGWIVAL